jgi:hypothetical protein
MIFFYSESCQHCSILLDTIKRHDTKKTIKIVCIDAIVNKIKHKIKAVPALMFMPSKEIIYGKAVFDYLLLPNRGYLFANNSSREKNDNSSSIISPVSLNKEDDITEPEAFSLGSVLADNYSDILDDNINSMNLNKDKLYNWGIIDNDGVPPPISTSNDKNNLEASKIQKTLPSIDELQKQRENIFKDI